MTVHVLVAQKGDAQMKRLTVDAYLEQTRPAATPLICMLAALQYDKAVLFRHDGTVCVVCPDDPTLHGYSYYDVALAAHVKDRDLALAADTVTGDMPVWRVPVRFDVSSRASISINAPTAVAAEKIFNDELGRVRDITRPDQIYEDPFFRLVRQDAEMMINDCFCDYVEEILGHNVDVAPTDIPVLQDTPDTAEVEWRRP